MSEDDKVVQLTSVSNEDTSPMTIQEAANVIIGVLNHMIVEQDVPHEYIIGLLDKIKQAYLFECFAGEEE
tara:strand:+ start:109 stop:318 length:210 start_codon:yes stop_codon:yes gene_type:complete